MNLVLLDPDAVTASGVVALQGDQARHVREVLRVRASDTVRVGIIDGPIGIGTVTSIEETTVTLQCVFAEVPPRPRIDLMLALPRPKVLRRLWAQLAAVGVGRIILTNAERVERHYFDTHVLTPGCYRPLLIEGLQQARDTRMPRVTIHRRFRVLVEDELDSLVAGATRLVADHRGEATIAAIQGPAKAGRHVLDPSPVEAGHHGADPGPGHAGHSVPGVLLAVGPEGGWNDFELTLLEAHGFQRVSMGARTLRTDTACIALLALVHASLDAHTIHDSRFTIHK